MAAGNSMISSVGKRFLTQILRVRAADSTHHHLLSSSPGATVTAFRRDVHTSVYDKNIDDQVRPTVVPDDAIESPSDNYWSPHPHTGVFGPTAEHPEEGKHTQSLNEGGNTVLEQQAWFRPLENVEKPHEEASITGQ
ncbi:Xaa-pro aminopeptidase [Thalictrum thalictroides]|uniref:Xaa-pro aminopeptidase n=1 Tax=Thalictrum thalictroides TaxID=46969 RepID=A0A7J6WMU4_THATH|nr:Xaa-pro aminopeptidase [Thalictrum thalictroides]